jgi:hypothetical protein
MSHPTNSEVISDAQYLVTLESQHREETDFSEGRHTCGIWTWTRARNTNKCSEDEQNSRSDVRFNKEGEVWGEELVEEVVEEGRGSGRRGRNQVVIFKQL